ncbi:MAG: hypothetical protein LWY06_08070 [Firmicutes bacterium]|nr:hypothetical protein [Bacillota bacterium]
MEFIKKEGGEAAIKALERAKKRFGDPMGTDKPRAYSKNLPRATDTYWVGVCPKCKLMMHAAFYTQLGVRYMCSGCGHKEGTY